MKKIGICADDYLILLEILTKIDRDLPIAEAIIYMPKELAESLPVEMMEQTTSDVFNLLDTDVVLILSEMPEGAEFFKDYDGKVINLTNKRYIDKEKKITDPLMGLLYHIALENPGACFNINYPLGIYGKQGVDVLMQETRAVFSFEDVESFLNMRMAFNTHFYKTELPEDIFNTELIRLKNIAGEISIRINPLSTVYIVDIFSQNNVKLPDATNIVEHDFSAADVTSDEKIYATSGKRMRTITGDYLHLKTSVIMEALKDALV